MTTRDATRAALFTALWTFIALFGASLLGWLQDLTAWASDDGGAVVFPNPAVLAKAAVAAVAAALSGLVGFAVRFAQAKGIVGGSAPAYRRTRPLRADRGASELVVIVVASLAIGVALVATVGAPR